MTRKLSTIDRAAVFAAGELRNRLAKVWAWSRAPGPLSSRKLALGHTSDAHAGCKSQLAANSASFATSPPPSWQGHALAPVQA